MKYITPSTHDFTKVAEPWKLEPKENESFDLHAVQMTFDADIVQTSDIVVKFFNYNVEEPLSEVRYSNFLDWIRKSTEHTKVEGVHSKTIHKFYMNFSMDVTLYHKDLKDDSIHYMTIEVEDGKTLKDVNGEECDIAIGEYIINVNKH